MRRRSSRSSRTSRFARTCPASAIPTRRIDAIDAVDFLYAEQMGCTIRQVAWAERTADPDVLTAAVGPALVPLESPLARVRGSENLVTLRGRFGGETTFGGLGAGGEPTAVAVMSDLLAIAREGVPVGVTRGGRRATVSPDFTSAYYVRFTVADRPGIIAALAAVFARHEINIDAILQEPGSRPGAGRSSSASIRAPSSAIDRAMKEMAAFDFHGEAPVVLPVLSTRHAQGPSHELQRRLPLRRRLSGVVPARHRHLPLPDLRRPARGRRTTSRRCAIAAPRRGCGSSTSATSARRGRTARACGARRSGSAPTSATTTSSRWTRAARTSSGRSASAAARRRRRVGEAVRQLAHRIVQGPRDDGARVDGRQMIARRAADPRRRLRLDRRHVRVARGVRGRGGHSGDRRAAARQGHRPRSSSSRSRTARSCSRSTPTSTAAWRSSSGWREEKGSTSPTR